jgi:TonB family protein
MGKRILFLLFVLFFHERISAQESMEMFYFNSNNDFLLDSIGCSYYRIAKTREARSEIDTVLTIYCNTERIRTVEIVNNRGQRNGSYTRYYEAGSLAVKGEFSEGNPVQIREWYTNEKQKSVERYEDENRWIEQYWDSLGNQIIKDGNGFCDCQLSEFFGGAKHQKGKVVNGQPDSVWIGQNEDGSLYYTERYDKGKFLGGISYDDLGNRYEYTVYAEAAEPVKGMQGFYQHVGKVLKYPAGARRRGVEGKVFVEFVVEKDGSITSLRAIRGIGSGCDEEAISAVGSSPKWKPAIERGQKVRTRYVVPITFKLG